MNYLVLGGAGRQGTAIVKGLRKLDPEGSVVVVDSHRFGDRDIFNDEFVELVDIEAARAIRDVNSDVIISALPFALNEQLGMMAIDSSKRWVDLGGHMQTTAKLHKYAEKKGGPPIATDQGLAPGLINILAWKVLQEHGSLHSMRLLCGGLPPRAPGNFLKYFLTFNADGLVNEYLNRIEGLMGGKICQLPNLSPTIPVRWDENRTFEAFATSGATPVEGFLDTLQGHGVETCVYETLRYPGHADAIKFLRDGGLRPEEISQVIKKTCSWPEIIRDSIEDRIFLGMDVHEEGGFASPDTRYRWEIRNGDGMTAMQRGTGYTAAVVAYLLAGGTFDDRCVVDYYDLKIPEFHDLITDLDLLHQVAAL